MITIYYITTYWTREGGRLSINFCIVLVDTCPSTALSSESDAPIQIWTNISLPANHKSIQFIINKTNLM